MRATTPRRAQFYTSQPAAVKLLTLNEAPNSEKEDQKEGLEVDLEKYGEARGHCRMPTILQESWGSSAGNKAINVLVERSNASHQDAGARR